MRRRVAAPPGTRGAQRAGQQQEEEGQQQQQQLQLQAEEDDGEEEEEEDGEDSDDDDDVSPPPPPPTHPASGGMAGVSMSRRFQHLTGSPKNVKKQNAIHSFVHSGGTAAATASGNVSPSSSSSSSAAAGDDGGSGSAAARRAAARAGGNRRCARELDGTGVAQLRGLFAAHDSDRDGMINRMQLNEVLEAMGIKATEGVVTRFWAGDATGAGTGTGAGGSGAAASASGNAGGGSGGGGGKKGSRLIDMKTFMSVASRVLEDEAVASTVTAAFHEQVRRQEQQLQTPSDGLLQKSELVKAMVSLDIDPTIDNILAYFELPSGEVDESRCVDEHSFLVVSLRHLGVQPVFSYRNEVLSVFQAFDENDSGHVSVSVIRHIMQDVLAPSRLKGSEFDEFVEYAGLQAEYGGEGDLMINYHAFVDSLLIGTHARPVATS